jgi:hypothetical protein
VTEAQGLRSGDSLTYSMRTSRLGRLHAQAVLAVTETAGQRRWQQWAPKAAANSAAYPLRTGWRITGYWSTFTARDAHARWAAGLVASTDEPPNGTIEHVQTLGTALQLSGSVITLGGLLWAWHKASGRLNQWRAAIVIRLAQIRHKIQTLRPAGIPSQEAFANLTVQIQLAADATLKRGGPTDDRLTRLENDHNTVLNLLAQQESSLRVEIDQAIADALETIQTDADTVRLRDIYPAVFGILVSITGYICQLIG